MMFRQSACLGPEDLGCGERDLAEREKVPGHEATGVDEYELRARHAMVMTEKG